ncbi:alkaline phosphatase [Corticibacter populi]|uniref:Alkaline phosphatase n=1 Tax=Corticibacter populi TaxID=1550736 RepID=A0A3M6R0J9_9BURK|nr:alkaline phosphatase D family protein [Corticibacter populi]RMX08409.1 alkaline phosphatase [Corticibacter populi]RZS35712.1 alkaline phosphatase D [Corticibacter populi]
MTRPFRSRRDFIIRIGSISATLAAGGVLSACGGDDDNAPGTSPDDGSSPNEPVRFDYGVASGDPLADRVILWTHAKYGSLDTASDEVALTWEVATDPAFGSLVASGETLASAATGFTAKVDATGLQAGRQYYYRFRAGQHVSAVGLTRTLPAAGIERVSLAVFSCSNYPAGYFHAYAEALKTGAEYAVHLGDYIYEYAAGGYASGDAQALDRVVDPAHEIISLDDYRRRYAQYRSDPDLKQMHAAIPMIAIWDDHEIANDTWREGAENHDESTEGVFAERVGAALQAYHEWLPIRTDASSDLQKIWRSFDFGDLLSLHMLETRVSGRDQQIAISELANPATAAAATAQLSATDRQMLGSAQQQWLTRQLAQSGATWQVLGQQVLMARMQFPVSILQHLNADSLTPDAQQAALQAIEAYLTAKATAAQAPQLLTEQQQALLDTSLNPLLGYNLDAWDGYPVARETLLQTARQLGKQLVVLAGDTHNAWHSDLTLLDGTKVGEEFATTSVSSPGFEEYLSGFAPEQIQQVFLGVVDTLKYLNSHQRGFLLMEFTQQSTTGHWYMLDTVKSRDYTVTLERSASLA